MARGTQLLVLVRMVRSELGKSENVAVGVDDVPQIKNAINFAYETLFDEHDWPHKRADIKIDLAAGQRFYDFPETLPYENIEQAQILWAGQWYRLTRGIDFTHYNAYDSIADERTSPAQRYDVKFTGTKEQLEIWPVPADGEQDLYLRGLRVVNRLVNDSDVCAIDDWLVAKLAAASLAKDETTIKKKMAEAGQRLETLKANTHSDDEQITFGPGQPQDVVPSQVIIRVR